MKILQMEGKRSDGIIIAFTERDIDKIHPEEFISITVKEEMSYSELKKYYPHIAPPIKSIEN